MVGGAVARMAAMAILAMDWAVGQMVEAATRALVAEHSK